MKDGVMIDVVSEIEPILHLKSDVIKLSGRMYGSVGESYEVRYLKDDFSVETKRFYLHPDMIDQGMEGSDEGYIEYCLHPLKTGLTWAIEEYTFRGELTRRVFHYYWVDDNPEDTPRYVLDHQIGEGAHGNVWLAHDSENGSEVCVKIAKPDAEYRLKKEFEVLRQWNHPSIVHPLDLYVDGGKFCLAMPYYKQSAFALKGQCDLRLVRSFCESMTSALAYLRQRGYSHNDISLSNILVGPDNRFILTDFSCMVQGDYYEDDAWKLGCSILELVTGKPFVAFTYHSPEMIDQELDRVGFRDVQVRESIQQCFQLPRSESTSIDDGLFPCEGLPNDCTIWTAVHGFCIVQKGNKFGLMNRFGTLVIPIEYDSLSQVGIHILPTRNTDGFPPRMRCLYRKGDMCGSYLIDKDFAILEIEMKREEWMEREMRT